MSAEQSDDSRTSRTRGVVDRTGPDPQAQAAIFLVESLIHALIARSIISAEDAMDCINIAAEACADLMEDADQPNNYKECLTILRAMAISISHDV